MENEGYTKITIPKDAEKGIGFACDIYVPDDVREDSNLFMSFAYEFSERENVLLRMLKSPMMIVHTPNEKDENGEELNFDEFDKNALIGNDGKPRGYSGVNVPFIEQYKRMISKAYEELKKRNILRQDTEEKIDLEGYSHQGVRAQRFAMLAPEKIRSVFIGGAYSSNPIPLEELDGEDLDYPIGFKGVDKIIGEDGTDRVLSDYKNVAQIIYVAEQELRYDGSFSRDGERMRDLGGKRTVFSKPTVSQHDISPDVVPVVLYQQKKWGNDINDRAENVMDILRNEGCALRKVKIYEGVDHHWSDPSKRLGSLNDLIRAVMSMDKAAIEGIFNPHETEIEGFDGGVERVDTTYEDKREALQSMIVGDEISEEDFYLGMDSLISTMVLNPEDDAYLYVEPKKFMHDFDSKAISNARALRDIKYTNLSDRLDEGKPVGFHFTSKDNIGSIYEQGLLALRGDNASGGLGREAINKSFLSYGEEGALQIFNRTILAGREVDLGSIRTSQSHKDYLPESSKFKNNEDKLSMLEAFEFARQYMSDRIYFVFDVNEAKYERDISEEDIDDINKRLGDYKLPGTNISIVGEIKKLDDEIDSLGKDETEKKKELLDKRSSLSILLRIESKKDIDALRGELINPEDEKTANIDRVDFNDDKLCWVDQIKKPHNAHSRIIETDEGLQGVIIKPKEVISIDGKKPATALEAMRVAYSEIGNIQNARLSFDPNMLDLFFEYIRMVEAYEQAGLLMNYNGRDVVDLTRIDIYPGLDDLGVRAEKTFIDFRGKGSKSKEDKSENEAKKEEGKSGRQDALDAAKKDKDYNLTTAKETVSTVEYTTKVDKEVETEEKDEEQK